MQTKINWFEIPSTNFSRAVKFYETIFDTKLRVEKFGPNDLGVFTLENGESIGGVVHGETYPPASAGVVLYLDAGPSIDQTVARIEPAGGRIQSGKMALPEGMGFIAYFFDTEGNRIGLHAMA